jgi:hypothetical protein
MPIDPSIPLQGIPVQSPVDRFAKLLQLKNAMQQQQIGGQQLQAATIENQQRQMLFNDQAKISQLLSQPDVNGDIGKAIPLMGPAGISGQSILNYTSAYSKLQSTIAGTAKARADALKANTEVQKQHLDLMGKTAQAIKDADYAPGAFFAGADAVLAANPDLKPQVDQQRAQVMALSGDPLKQRAMIQQLTDGALASSGEGDRIAKERADTALTNVGAQQKGASLAGQTVAAVTDQPSYDTWRQSLPPGVAARIPQKYSPSAVAMIQKQGMSAGEQTTTAQAATNAAETAFHNRVEEGQGQQKVGLEGAKVGLERQRLNLEMGMLPGDQSNLGQGAPDPAGSHPEVLAKVPPGLAAQVRRIAAYQGAPPPPGSRSPQAGLINSLLSQYYPSYDQRIWNSSNDMMTALNSGKQGQNIQSLNTLPVHLDQALEVFKAMKNKSFVPGNEIYNHFVTQFGSSAATNYDTVKNVLAGEMATAMKGVATDVEVDHVMNTLQNSKSPEQGIGAAIVGLHAIGAKINTYKEQATQAHVPEGFTPLLPSAAAVFQKYGITPLAKPSAGKVIVKDPEGNSHPFRDQEEADRFKKKAGIK